MKRTRVLMATRWKKARQAGLCLHPGPLKHHGCRVRRPLIVNQSNLRSRVLQRVWWCHSHRKRCLFMMKRTSRRGWSRRRLLLMQMCEARGLTQAPLCRVLLPQICQRQVPNKRGRMTSSQLRDQVPISRHIVQSSSGR